jgi:hypothetical protein
MWYKLFSRILFADITVIFSKLNKTLKYLSVLSLGTMFRDVNFAIQRVLQLSRSVVLNLCETTAR